MTHDALVRRGLIIEHTEVLQGHTISCTALTDAGEKLVKKLSNLEKPH